MLQFFTAGMLEAEHLTALGIDPRHHMTDGAVFPGSIHRLEDQQDGIAVAAIEQFLLGAQLLDVLLQECLVLLFRLVHGIDLRRPFFEVDRVAVVNAKVF